jgi:hypothetical protein
VSEVKISAKINILPHEKEAIQRVITEYASAVKKFGPFHSAHEGFAVLKEEVDELWEEVKAKKRDKKNLEKEATQVAAMGLRFLIDTCLNTNDKFK